MASSSRRLPRFLLPRTCIVREVIAKAGLGNGLKESPPRFFEMMDYGAQTAIISLAVPMK